MHLYIKYIILLSNTNGGYFDYDVKDCKLIIDMLSKSH